MSRPPGCTLLGLGALLLPTPESSHLIVAGRRDHHQPLPCTAPQQHPKVLSTHTHSRAVGQCISAQTSLSEKSALKLGKQFNELTKIYIP